MRAYQKPQITKVALKSEEAVLAVCKTATGGNAKISSFGSCVTNNRDGAMCKSTNGS